MADDHRERAAGLLLELLPLFMGNVLKYGNLFGPVQAAHYRVLALLSKEGSLPMSEIARRQYISKPYMTALMDYLVAEGFAERHPHPKDRRVIEIVITDAGRDHMRSSLDRFKGDLKALLSHLDENDLKVLCTSVESMNTILVKIP
jgi:DNA-binding MarR family transcriptional regulator